MTAADFKNFSLGFIIEYCLTRSEIASGEYESDEKKYLKMKDIYPFVQEDYENGKKDEQAYIDFMKRFTELEEQYGWDY